MNPRVETVKEDDDVLTFTLSGVNVSLANAIRRTLLSDIPLIVFKTTPYEANKANITVNTSRLNNEILKQRLSCIPIHITDMEMPIQNYLMEAHVENLTDTIKYVTTEDFRIKNVQTGEYLSESDTRTIFPRCEQTGYYIDFARLRPKISDEILGEKLHLTCEFSIGTAREDSMFNAVSTCSYGMTVDATHQELELAKKVKEWTAKEMSKDQIAFESKNWKLLDGQRVTKADSFDFIIQTVGVYSNYELMRKSCSILIDKLRDLDTIIDIDKLEINVSDNTLQNSYDVILKNEDYTIGKIMEYFIYTRLFQELKTVSFCGFKKMHPHDSDSIIRIAYKDPADKETLKQNLKMCIANAIVVYETIKSKF